MHHSLKIRPADDIASQRSTLSFYKKEFPNTTSLIMNKAKEISKLNELKCKENDKRENFIN